MSDGDCSMYGTNSPFKSYEVASGTNHNIVHNISTMPQCSQYFHITILFTIFPYIYSHNIHNNSKLKYFHITILFTWYQSQCFHQPSIHVQPQLKSLEGIWGTLSPTYHKLILFLQLNPIVAHCSRKGVGVEKYSLQQQRNAFCKTDKYGLKN